MRFLAVAAVLVACAPASEPEPVALRLSLVNAERDLRPTPALLPRTFIDGVERNVLEVEYLDLDDEVTSHLVELRYSSPTAIRTLQVSLDSFGTKCKSDGGMQMIEQKVCVYDSGDLRYGSETVDGICTADIACRPTCQPLQGCATARCTSLITSFSPLASHLGCAPIGPRKYLEPCLLVDTPDGAHDDCGEHLLCVNGRCRATCGSEVDCTGCANVPGHAIELRVCPS